MKVRLLQPARRELVEAISFYNNERAGLGDASRDEAWRAVQRIREFPDAWSPLGDGIRRCQLQRFPYGVIYACDASEITILAFAHLHRHPEYWRSRSPRA